MPAIYFGHTAKGNRKDLTLVETPVGSLEPCRPSQFKLYAAPTITSRLWSIVLNTIGHLIATLSMPLGYFIPLSSAGEMYNPPKEFVQFPKVKFGFAFSRGVTPPEKAVTWLGEKNFTSTMFRKQTVWLTENLTKGEFLELMAFDNIDENCPTPDRYLNPSSFKSYLTVNSLTTRICETFHLLSSSGVQKVDPTPIITRSALEGDWVSMLGWETPEATSITESESFPVFKEPGCYKPEGASEKFLLGCTAVPGSASGISINNPGVFYNPFAVPKMGFTRPGNLASITAPGKIFKFHPRLAESDPNIIGDVIGRRFLTCLGASREEQFSTLHELKSGLSALRLSLLGDVWAHLYKCLDIAIDAQCGLVPVISPGDVYEGCVLMGGPGAVFSVQGVTVGFDSVTDLKNDFLTMSSHSNALSLIATKFDTDASKQAVKSVTNMFDLRELCLDLAVSSDDRDYIIQQAQHLEFGQVPWVISPARIKDCFLLMANLSGYLDTATPFSRLCLFSRDAVLIALSCFGETSAPSWDIPNGSKFSITSALPPTVPPSATKPGSKSRGDISDAAWVMPVRETDILSAVDEFRRLSKEMCYRSVSTVAASKNGMRVFSRDRMGVFWDEMKAAMYTVNPDSRLLKEAEGSGKRKERGSDEAAGTSSVFKKRRGF